jgi:hypothetical protein
MTARGFLNPSRAMVGEADADAGLLTKDIDVIMGR